MTDAEEIRCPHCEGVLGVVARGSIDEAPGSVRCLRCNAVIAREWGAAGRPPKYCPDCKPLVLRAQNREWKRQQRIRDKLRESEAEAG